MYYLMFGKKLSHEHQPVYNRGFICKDKGVRLEKSGRLNIINTMNPLFSYDLKLIKTKICT